MFPEKTLQPSSNRNSWFNSIFFFFSGMFFSPLEHRFKSFLLYSSLSLCLFALVLRVVSDATAHRIMLKTKPQEWPVSNTTTLLEAALAFQKHSKSLEPLRSQYSLTANFLGTMRQLQVAAGSSRRLQDLANTTTKSEPYQKAAATRPEASSRRTPTRSR